MNPIFYMPTKVICEKNAVLNHGHLLKALGKTALIVTGKNSSRKNGSLDDVINTLNNINMKFYVFDEVEENPSTETIEKIRNFSNNKDIDVVIGIGGGSPMDASKAASVLIANPNMKVQDLFTAEEFNSLPVVAVPTTAGTGSETTPYSILTDHSIKNKLAIKTKLFPVLAFIDASYLMDTPKEVTINTAIDALSHLIEGYLSTAANLFSNALAESGMSIFRECMDYLNEDKLSFEVREKLLIASSIAGMVIAQSGTSLPHGMGYPLTYNHNIPHGMANGLLLKEYLSSYQGHDCERTNKILTILGFNTLKQLGDYISKLSTVHIKISREELETYAKYMISNEAKLKNHPFKVTYEEILAIYEKSLI